MPSKLSAPLVAAGVERVKAVLDPNAIISALLSPGGSPAKVLRAWIDGRYDLTTSELVSGDGHLPGLAGQLPVCSPAGFPALLDSET